MKIIDLQEWRAKKQAIVLEERIATLSLSSNDRHDTVRQIKLCFKEWLKVSGY